MVERSLSMREVAGSMPASSIVFSRGKICVSFSKTTLQFHVPIQPYILKCMCLFKLNMGSDVNPILLVVVGDLEPIYTVHVQEQKLQNHSFTASSCSYGCSEQFRCITINLYTFHDQICLIINPYFLQPLIYSY